MVKRSDRYAFTNVFVFCPEDGSLELFAKGGKKVHTSLQEAFCQALLGIDIGPADPIRPAYKLDHLLDPTHSLPTDPEDRVAKARIVRMRLQLRDASLMYIELKADPKGPKNDLHAMIEQFLDDQHLPIPRLRVRQAAFRLTFMSNGRGRAKTLTFNVSCPDSCDLKSKPDEMRSVGERCLKLWGITND